MWNTPATAAKAAGPAITPVPSHWPLRASIRGELDAEINAARQKLRQQQDDMVRQQKELQQKAEAVDEQVRARVIEQKQQLERKLREQMLVEIKDKDEQLNEAKVQLKAAQEKELAIRKREREIEQQRADLEQSLRKKLNEERASLISQVQAKAREELGVQLRDRETALAELQAKVQQATAKELAFLKEKRDLEEKARNADLEAERRLQEQLQAVREQALKEIDEQHRLKLMENEQKVQTLLKQIEEMKRKAEQGSQQAQGEVQEVALEELLGDLFRKDSIEPVPKGVRGADVIQRVFDDSGMDCGLILWESKRTRHWSKDWLPKLRDDLRAVKASRSVIVSEQLPERIQHFGQIEGVWVVSWACVYPVAAVLREGLIGAAKARRALEGQHGKMELVYNYLTGQEFCNRVSGIVEAFVTMGKDLEEEKRAFTTRWNRRAKQLERVLLSTSGLYGDLQGIIGSTLPEIRGMSLSALDDGQPDGKALPDGEEVNA